MRVAKKRASCAAVDASLSKTGFVLFALLARRLLLVGILEEILGAGCQESSEKCLILFVELSRSLQSASPPRGARTRTFRPFETGETDFLWREAARRHKRRGTAHRRFEVTKGSQGTKVCGRSKPVTCCYNGLPGAAECRAPLREPGDLSRERQRITCDLRWQEELGIGEGLLERLSPAGGDR